MLCWTLRAACKARTCRLTFAASYVVWQLPSCDASETSMTAVSRSLCKCVVCCRQCTTMSTMSNLCGQPCRSRTTPQPSACRNSRRGLSRDILPLSCCTEWLRADSLAGKLSLGITCNVTQQDNNAARQLAGVPDEGQAGMKFYPAVELLHRGDDGR